MHCASDQASLCWACDAKVHSANFLVARHSRNLLCRVCQGPTPWSAAGAKLRPTASACEQCVDGEEEEEQQVVPWSPPPPPESFSSVEEAASGGETVVLGKRFRSDCASLNTRPDV
ncbi:B-box zinc finger protein 32 [Phtheirospermum japonicum]|uniref:B-box zinc finger protein 32 n=1 Tax=Phtheirospermum japonicum TaxID=374723 RepID=A0A830CHD0_9LAMI|nr:B-box zinc finger protein 32 [Phtheirospermum japonicum]